MELDSQVTQSFASGGAGAIPVVAQFSNVHLFNQVGSGIVARIYKLTVDSVALAGAVTGGMVCGYYNTLLAGGVYTQRTFMDQRYNGSTACQLAGNNDANPTVQPTFYLDRCALAPGQNFVFERKGGTVPIGILLPGQGYLVHAAFSMDLDAIFQWTEVPFS